MSAERYHQSPQASPEPDVTPMGEVSQEVQPIPEQRSGFFSIFRRNRGQQGIVPDSNSPLQSSSNEASSVNPFDSVDHLPIPQRSTERIKSEDIEFSQSNPTQLEGRSRMWSGTRRDLLRNAVVGAGAAIVLNHPVARALESRATEKDAVVREGILPAEPSVETLESNPILLPKLERPPENAQEVIPGKVWKGENTPGMRLSLDAKLKEYKDSGVKDGLAMGIEKGSVYLKGPDGKFYEFAIGERGVYHVTDPDEDGVGTLQRVLVARDLGNGKIQLDEDNVDFFDLTVESADILAGRMVTGEPGSDVPTYQKLAERGLLTINADNWKENKAGQGLYATETLNKDGQVNTISPDLLPGLGGEATYNPQILTNSEIVDYQNGHNLTLGMKNFIDQQYGSKGLEILGYPISEGYWTNQVIGGQRRAIFMQLFERGSVTYNPANPEEWQYEGGLIGNFFQDVITGVEDGEQDPSCEIETPYPKEIKTEKEIITIINRSCKSGFDKGRTYEEWEQAVEELFDGKKLQITFVESPDQVPTGPDDIMYNQSIPWRDIIAGASGEGKFYYEFNSEENTHIVVYNLIPNSITGLSEQDIFNINSSPIYRALSISENKGNVSIPMSDKAIEVTRRFAYPQSIEDQPIHYERTP